MAIKNFWILDSIAAGGGDHGAMQEDGIAPATALFPSSTGWNVGSITTTNAYADMDRGVSVARGALDATFGWRATAPNNAPNGTRGNAFRTPSPLTGNFAAGNWTLNMIMRSNSGTAQRGAIRASIWRGPNADGTGAVQVGTVAESAATVAPSTTNTTPHTVTLAPGAFTLNNEYLFFVITWRITVAGTANANNWIFSLGSGVVTADFTAVTPTVTVNPTGYAETHAYGLPTINNVPPLQTVSMTGHYEGGGAFGLPAYLMRSNQSGYAEVNEFGSTSFRLRPAMSGYLEPEGFGSPSVRLTTAVLGHDEVDAVGSPTILLAGWSVLTEWDASPETDLSHYNVYRSMDFDGPYTRIATNVTETSYLDETVATNTIYWYYSTAVDFAGNESPPSAKSEARVNLSLMEVRPEGLAPAAAYGAPAIKMSSFPHGVAHGRSMGIFQSALRVGLSGYLEAEDFGVPAVIMRAAPLGFPSSGGAFGSPAVRIAAFITGYQETEGFGEPEVRIPPPVMTVSMLGYGETEAFGLPTIIPRITINMTGLGPAPAYGALVARLLTTPDPLLGVSGYGEASIRLSAVLGGYRETRDTGVPGILIRANLEGLANHEPGYGAPAYYLWVVPEGYLEEEGFGSFGVSGDINVPIWKPKPDDNRLQIIRPSGDLQQLVRATGRLVILEVPTGKLSKEGPGLSRVRKLEVPSGTVRED